MNQAENLTPQTSRDLSHHGQSASQKFKSTQGAIGPSQFSSLIEEITKEVRVQDWKNIPTPLCEFSTGLLHCVEYIKRFVLFQEQRFGNLQLSVDHSIYNMSTQLDQCQTVFQQGLG